MDSDARSGFSRYIIDYGLNLNLEEARASWIRDASGGFLVSKIFA